MAKKTKNAKIAGRKKPREQKVEDPRRFVVVGPSGRQIYPGPGVPLAQAERLRDGLRIRTKLVEIAITVGESPGEEA